MIKMKRIYFITLFFLIAIFLFSCKKETVVYATTADQITTQLKKVIADNYIKRIIAWDDQGGFPPVSPDFGIGWTFSNGFITITGYGLGIDQTRNLLYLDKYKISNVLLTDGTSSPALILHFKN
ncbi:MAG: hypothetical protein Q8S01_11020 [Ignavibacteria bacterium]|nr:hypothetical protein [Ignavibacteria bacterium]